MISFATLFLGLVFGTVPVDVVVDERVAAVELFLDDALVARIEAPPWRADVPFGEDLGPHELLAVSYDPAGAELGRAQQWINLPRPTAEGHLRLEGGEGGRGVTARVIWESVVSESPSAARVLFDNRELAGADPRRFVLPDHDPGHLHYLRVELEFDGGVVSVIDLTFGGGFSDLVESYEMALPILIGGRAGTRSAEQLRGRFVKGGESIPVLAFDKGPAEVVLVRDRAVQLHFDRLGSARFARYVARLRKDQLVRFLLPFARLDPRAKFNYELFPSSEELTPREGGLFWHLLAVRPSAQPLERQRLADAVAVAGMISSAHGRRRAVVVILSDRPSDASLLAPPAVRRYLEALRVPLVVWSVGEPSPEARAEWGPMRDVSTLTRLERATRELARLLERQRIVWLEGIHLPQRVTVTAGTPPVAFAN